MTNDYQAGKDVAHLETRVTALEQALIKLQQDYYTPHKDGTK